MPHEYSCCQQFFAINILFFFYFSGYMSHVFLFVHISNFYVRDLYVIRV